MRVPTLLLLLGLYAAQASPAGIKVEDYAKDDADDEDTNMDNSALDQLDKEHVPQLQRLRSSQEKALLTSKKGLQMNQEYDHHKLGSEESAIGEMDSKLTALGKFNNLQKRWQELATELHAARVEEFLDEIPQMPKTLLGLEAEVPRLENLKKVEGLEKESAPKSLAKKLNLKQLSAGADQLMGAARQKRFTAVQTEMVTLKNKVEAADLAVAESMRVLDKAIKQTQSAKEALDDSDKLWQESEKELRERDRLWAQKERAHLEQEYQTISGLKESAEKKLALDKSYEEELSGQQMLTSVSAAMQEAHMNGATLKSFTASLKKDLDKEELDVADFLRYAKKEKNPAHLAGWGLFKQGPASITAGPIASALKQLNVNANVDELASKLYKFSA